MTLATDDSYIDKAVEVVSLSTYRPSQEAGSVLPAHHSLPPTPPWWTTITMRQTSRLVCPAYGRTSTTAGPSRWLDGEDLRWYGKDSGESSSRGLQNTRPGESHQGKEKRDLITAGTRKRLKGGTVGFEGLVGP